MIGLTLVEAAQLMQWGKSTLQRLEKGQTEKIRTHDIVLLGEIYQLKPEETADLVALAEQTAVKNWWHDYGSLISPNFDVYMGLESSAREMMLFQSSAVPGILQTADYARTLDRLFFPDDTGTATWSASATRRTRYKTGDAQLPRLGRKLVLIAP
ncbi:Scr1 family TA system antitoxin-like transcriptional regulator [Nocardia asiatica]|uniref:helix-turn-helix domain-containing protein n=1 Tax=Nocardia asiatica TaxID=209252 RepID=UPI003EE3B77B